MVLFNQVTLRNILEGWEDLSTPELCKAVAKLNAEQKADALLFLNNNIEELAVLPAGQGSLAVKLVKQILDEMPIPSMCGQQWHTQNRVQNKIRRLQECSYEFWHD